MINFLLKGVIRDRSRSLFPILIIVTGVMLTVVLYCYIQGAVQLMLDSTARFSTGHVIIMSKAYAEEADQVPNDLAFIGVESLLNRLSSEHPDMIWAPRIKFGGLIDIPDASGETKAQGPAVGMAVGLFSGSAVDRNILNLDQAIIRGRMPDKPGEILISEDFSRRLEVNPGETATLISSTMYGSMAIVNFTVAGTVRFGINVMDRGALIADISDIRSALDMQDAAGEILGFSPDMVYREMWAQSLAGSFNSEHGKTGDEFAPVMKTLREFSRMGETLDMMSLFSGMIIVIFLTVMSIVLWNAGLMGSLRRYGEIGVRLAMGEKKGHLYRTLILESMVVGFFGTIIGTIIGLGISFFLQEKGINIGSMIQNASIMMTNVMRARITPVSFIIGFIPGLMATILGTSISGIGIFKRQTSQLIKELES